MHELGAVVGNCGPERPPLPTREIRRILAPNRRVGREERIPDLCRNLVEKGDNLDGSVLVAQFDVGAAVAEKGRPMRKVFEIVECPLGAVRSQVRSDEHRDVEGGPLDVGLGESNRLESFRDHGSTLLRRRGSIPTRLARNRRVPGP